MKNTTEPYIPLARRTAGDCADAVPAQTAKFVAVKLAVMYGSECVAVARSHTMAKRISAALNEHLPNREGV